MQTVPEPKLTYQPLPLEPRTQRMKTTQLARYAFRLSYGQVNELASAAGHSAKSSGERNTVRSAALLAALGIGLSSFSMKQMVTKQPKQRKY